MKECPICHKTYDDTYSFCTKDGCQLNHVKDSEKLPSQPPQKKTRTYLKKILIAVAILIVALALLVSHLMKAATYIRTEPNAITVPKAGGTCKVEIDYDGYIWTINHQPEWVELVENDQDFDVTIEPNMTGQLREGSITVQSGKQLTQTFIKQNAFTTYIRPNETSIHFGIEGGEKKIAIATDGCDLVAEYLDWMDVTMTNDGGLFITCPKNDGDYRTSMITVKEDNVRSNIYVSQGGTCEHCHGMGMMTCSSCFGRGGSGYGYYYSSCMICGGSGRIPCWYCKGSGYRE